MGLFAASCKRHRIRPAMCLGLLVALGLPTGPPSLAAQAPQVKGQGSGTYLAPPFTGDWVDISLEAAGAGGHFEVVHIDKLGNTFDRLVGVVTCLSVEGRTAITTGIITAAQAPELAGDLVGKALAITVVDDGPVPLVGVSFPLDQIPPCSTWPVNTLINRGSYSISG